MAELLTALCGLIGGAVGGLLGVGGGVIFVPALVIILDEPQLAAEATSLLAIVPVALVGTWRQQRHGNVRFRDAAVVGSLALPGVGVGVVVANSVSQRTLELAFAGLVLLVALQLARRALRGDGPAEPRGDGAEAPRAA